MYIADQPMVEGDVHGRLELYAFEVTPDNHFPRGACSDAQSVARPCWPVFEGGWTSTRLEVPSGGSRWMAKKLVGLVGGSGCVAKGAHFPDLAASADGRTFRLWSIVAAVYE